MGRAASKATALLLLAAIGGGVWWTFFRETGPAPLEVVVKRGDTLGKIAKAHGVTVDELRSWNGIEGDLIEVGQVILVYLDEPAPAAAAPQPQKGKGPRKKKRRSSGGGEEAEAPEEAPARSWDPLVMPRAKRCLQGPSLDDAGDEMAVVGSAGLERDAIARSMRAFLPEAFRCMPDDAAVAGTIRTTITVGCDGRVSTVEVLGSSGITPDVVACVADVVRYTPFPAHDMPDGMTFEYPIELDWSP